VSNVAGRTVAIYCEDVGHLRQGESVPRKAVLAHVLVGGRYGVVEVTRLHGRLIRRIPSAEGLRRARGPSAPDLSEQDPGYGHFGYGPRWRFECNLCSRTVPTHREKLRPILQKLVDAGVLEISLEALAARLRSS